MPTPKIGKWTTPRGEVAVVLCVTSVEYAAGYIRDAQGFESAAMWDDTGRLDGERTRDELLLYLGPLTIEDLPADLQALVAPKPLAVAEVLAKDGAKPGDKYTDGVRKWTANPQGQELLVEQDGPGYIGDIAAAYIHIPGLRRVEKRKVEVADFVFMPNSCVPPTVQHSVDVSKPAPQATLWAEIPGSRRTVEVDA